MVFPVVVFTFLFYYADLPLDVAIWLHFCTGVRFPTLFQLRVTSGS